MSSAHPSPEDKFTGTQPVAERHRFDEGALAAWMSRHVPGCSGALQVLQFKGGQSNPTFLLTGQDGRQRVLRAKPGPAAKLLRSAHAIEREYRVLGALAGTGFPVPGAIALCEDEGVIGRAFYLMDYVEGRVLAEPWLPGLAPAERAALYDEMNRVIAMLHTLDVQALGLADFGRPGNYFARQIDRWSKQYRASETERIEPMERLMEWLPGHIPPGDETTLVHGDFRLGNVILHPTQPRVLAVLDWELSTLGHPLADLSYFCMPWHTPSVPLRGMADLPLHDSGIPTSERFIADYCRRTGRGAIAHWEFYVAYNLFRSAGILQGIVKRALDGTASSAHALEEGGRIVPLAELGWQFAQRL